MRVNLTNVCRTFAITLILISAACSQTETTKNWQFRAEGGSVKIQVVGPPEAPSLEILYDDEAHPSLSVEVGFIRNVLQGMSSAGLDPRSLRGIHMRGFVEPDVARRVAVAGFHSKEWKSSTTIPGGAERVVKDLLNSIGAYDALNTAFEGYGLRVKVVGVEKVSSSRCSDLNLPEIKCRIYHNPRLPTGGNVFLSLAKM